MVGDIENIDLFDSRSELRKLYRERLLTVGGLNEKDIKEPDCSSS